MSEIRRHIEKPQYVIAKFKRRITDLDEDAERTEKSIQIRLDLGQKHLALRETRTVSVMSASVFAFTIITIIFTPLSFATSLFALSVEEFAHHQTTFPDRQDPVYGTSYIVTSLGMYRVFRVHSCTFVFPPKLIAKKGIKWLSSCQHSSSPQ
jgi:Mg2+ and Co2+ transporter CorA